MDLRQKIIRKLQCPELFEQEVERCLPWPTKAAPRRQALRWLTARGGGRYMAPVTLKIPARVMHKGARRPVHQVIQELRTGEAPGQGAQLCRTPFCVNPAHWYETHQKTYRGLTMDIRQKITAKLQCPELFDPGVEVERCLPWPTKAQSHRHTIRRVRAYNGSCYMAPITLKTLPRLMFKGTSFPVHRLIQELITGEVPGQGTQLCRTPFCVNTAHWDFSAPTPEATPDEGPPDPSQEAWTLSEARELLDGYLSQHPYPPLDPDHNLLIDIPRDLLREALRLIQKEDFLP